MNKSENAYVMGAVARESSCGWDLSQVNKFQQVYMSSKGAWDQFGVGVPK